MTDIHTNYWPEELTTPAEGLRELMTAIELANYSDEQLMKEIHRRFLLATLPEEDEG